MSVEGVHSGTDAAAVERLVAERVLRLPDVS